MVDGEKNWIDSYIRHLHIERRLSPLTCRHYRRDLESFARWCRQQGLADWSQVDGEHVRAFTAACYRRGLGARSIQRQLSASRSFFRFLVRQSHVRANPVEGVRAPKAPKRLPGNLDADRMAKLLDIGDDDPLGLRDKAMLELFYSSGLRLAELASLDLGSVDTADATVRVTGKGNRERVVPVGRQARKALRAWQAARKQLAAPEEAALFVSSRGTRLRPRSIQARVDHWARRQGIDTKVHPHLFRHSCASHVLESSHDLRAVQELLGHANISTTQIYTHLDFQHLAQVYDQTHPRARRKTRG